ncbi:MAG: pyrroloquinoline quinone biosynthesis protein PqqE [Rhodospirillales bacterium]
MSAPQAPWALLAELTHRCPLACPYCSNPLALTAADAELDSRTWTRVFREAADLGVLHLHLSGGEPAARRDLEDLVTAGRDAGLYCNLITSGIGLTERRLAALAEAGLDHLQLSLQGTSAEAADRIAGYRGGHERKRQVGAWTAALGLPLTVNAVMHRQNLDRLEETVDLAVALGARRLEIANVQFHGWAALNRPALMPTADQLHKADAVVAEARAALWGRLAIDYVPSDHYARYPKACMGGWGRSGLVVSPDGRVLPCHAADGLPGLVFDRVTDKPLAEIWERGAAFEAYRGTAWMQEPCRSCERREIDYGGCRCQALALAGDAAATDPTCSKSPLNATLAASREEAASGPVEFVYRGR